MEDASHFHNLQDEGILRQLAPGIVARIFPGINVMLSVVTIEPHSSSPVHSHPNEQWGVCLEGEWIRTQDGEDYHVRAGDFWQTPPNMPHERADCQAESRFDDIPRAEISLYAPAR